MNTWVFLEKRVSNTAVMVCDVVSKYFGKFENLHFIKRFSDSFSMEFYFYFLKRDALYFLEIKIGKSFLIELESRT